MKNLTGTTSDLEYRSPRVHVGIIGLPEHDE